MPNCILFLSIMDFTDKGIQVVKFTPEYFGRMGWEVHYGVTRDESIMGSYCYQPVINPNGITVWRTKMPSLRFLENANSRLIRNIYSKLRGYLSIIKLVRIGYRVLQDREIDVFYGGGPHGVLACNILKFLSGRRTAFSVSRFYGVWDLYSKMIMQRNWLKSILNFDILMSFCLPADLAIITNDGTQGDKALAWLCPTTRRRVGFFVNGTDRYDVDPDLVVDLRLKLGIDSCFSAVCVTRLVSIKRVDRCIRILECLINKYNIHKFKLVIVGDGEDRGNLQRLANSLGVSDNIVFVGSVENTQVKNYMAAANMFFSMYDVSNVGNPLLEAIRANKIIFTLNCGDTASWITHGVNGFIYNDDEFMVDAVARDILNLMDSPTLAEAIRLNLKETERSKLWTWDERLRAEYAAVSEGLDEKRKR